MPNIEIKQLYNHERVPADKTLALLLYLPFGIILFLFRLIVFLPVFLFCSILPNTNLVQGLLLKLVCFCLGIAINIENNEKKEDVDAYISNNISILDHIVMKILTGSTKPSSEIDTRLSLLCGEKYFGTIANLDAFKKNLSVFMSSKKVPIYFQPEGVMTNGKAVLKFNTWPFSMCSKFQPVVINIDRPILNIAANTMDAHYWTDVFFYMFSPLTVYNVQYLPSIEKKAFSDEDLANISQQAIAHALKIEAVDHKSADMKEWLKRHLLELKRTAVVQNNRSANYAVSPEMTRMGLQVKEVLPLVPMEDIIKDLIKTRNVDVTITNILDGAVDYIPESVNAVPVASTSSPIISTSSSFGPSSSNGSKDPFNTAAESFGKSASERSLSFQERKRLLIENARRRYIEKHGLNLVALNNC
ncbi:PREDICTED: ancient ubiquitous protein 1-like [Nicrophorus vespilloides]|uniref:Lipid droplet-regulating VLDL assembly factor AUP1 n=1 Tax=Nicrophorus vespilloides TaxID=110193 RepID=A0ABM1MHP9_NICVS|nr:PREDICTED: ancient ubiquitous protein 1-like [Nicrophorus vespilloides]